MSPTTTHDDRRRRIARDVERDLGKGDLGRIVQASPSQQIRPTEDDIEVLGLRPLAEAAADAEDVAARAGEQAHEARRRVGRLAKAGATTAEQDEAEIEATTLEREARPLQSAAYKSVVDLVVAYRLAIPGARAAYAARAAEAHREAVDAHARLTAALDARESAYRKIGQPGRERHFSSDVGPRSLGNPGTVTATEQNLARMVEAFPTRAVARIAEEDTPR